MRNSTAVRTLVAEHGVVRRAEHPDLAGSLDWLHRRGELSSPLPGILVPAGAGQDFETRVKALHAWRPDAVLAGLAAARLSYWPQAPVTMLEAHTAGTPRAAGWLLAHRTRPPEHWVLEHGVPLTHPAWTAVWLAAQDEGQAIDEALRRGAVSLEQLQAALADMPAGRGHARRRAVVEASRSNPWSQLERRLHSFLRGHGFTRWSANRAISLDGRLVFPDVAFDDVPLVLEAMSWTFHGNRQSFLGDNRRIADLVAAGWVYLPITWQMLDDEEALLRLLRAAHRQASRLTAAGGGARTLKVAPSIAEFDDFGPNPRSRGRISGLDN
ncbi:hypothetical protein [Luteococcus peritonei]|uniref:DUF559 domain-containing protein n=1 Tax=Luteococcus peritonei TaxID=88874 RepID=A0ABW4RUU8_9ACTN